MRFYFPAIRNAELQLVARLKAFRSTTAIGRR